MQLKPTQVREIGEGTAATDARLAAARDELGRQATEALRSGNVPAFEDLANRRSAVVAEQAAMKAKTLAAARDAVAAQTPSKPTLTTKFTGKRRLTVEAGVHELAKLVDQRLLPTFRVNAIPPKRGTKRSYYLIGTNSLHMTKDAPVDVVIHEGGHLIEDVSPDLHQAALGFLRRRTQGEALQSLRLLTGIKGYGPKEVAWPDLFFDPYVGRDYKSLATEVVSMGLQFLWRDPVAFAAKDPDFFDFLYRAMRGDFSP